MNSIWAQTCELEKRPSLQSDITTDVAIIGAGMCGVLTAYLLQQSGIDSVIIEASRIGSGMTQNTTAKITSQHGVIYDKLTCDFDARKAAQYAQAHEHAIQMYEDIVLQNNIECHFEKKPAYLYTLNEPWKIEKEAIAARHAGIDAISTKQTSLPFQVAAAMKFENQAQFHPLEFIQAICPGLTIYENTLATDIKDKIIYTKRGNVRARHIVFACHFPFINFPGYYFMRMYQQRSYVLALKNAADLDGMYIDESEQGYSFRSFGDTLLLGGAGHKCGQNQLGGKYEVLTNAAQQFYPQSEVLTRWSAQDCIPLDNIPYIGKFSSSTPEVYVATGFKKWGMTSSMVSAMVIRDLILNGRSEFEELFSPARFNLNASYKDLLANISKAVSGLSRQAFHVPEAKLAHILKGHGGVVEHDGKKIGVYRDEDNTVHMVSTKCSHLGCQLSWNPDERSWDCPCHGSRFDYMGNTINNPALKPISII